MNMIVAVDKNWAIGNGNKLLVSIPQDMKFSLPGDDEGKGSGNGQKDTGELPRRTAIKEACEYCAYDG